MSTIAQLKKVEFDLVAALGGPAAEPSDCEQGPSRSSPSSARKNASCWHSRRMYCGSPPLSAGAPWNPAGSGCRLSNLWPRWSKPRAIGNQSQERRLAKTSVRTRYQAPQHLRGSRMRLVDGRQLEIPEHGLCELAVGACPGYGPHGFRRRTTS